MPTTKHHPLIPEPPTPTKTTSKTTRQKHIETTKIKTPNPLTLLLLAPLNPYTLTALLATIIEAILIQHTNPANTITQALQLPAQLTTQLLQTPTPTTIKTTLLALLWTLLPYTWALQAYRQTINTPTSKTDPETPGHKTTIKTPPGPTTSKTTLTLLAALPILTLATTLTNPATLPVIKTTLQALPVHAAIAATILAYLSLTARATSYAIHKAINQKLLAHGIQAIITTITPHITKIALKPKTSQTYPEYYPAKNN